MHPLSDKDLDRMSREAAEQYDVEQSTSGWEKLEQKLIKHLPESGRKERRRYFFLIWLFTLLSGGGLIWMLTNTSPQQITLKERSTRPTVRGGDNPAQEPLQSTGKVATESADDKSLVGKDLDVSGDEKAQVPQPNVPSAQVADERNLKDHRVPALSEDIPLTPATLTRKPSKSYLKKSPESKQTNNQRPINNQAGDDTKLKLKVTNPPASPGASADQTTKTIADKHQDYKDESNKVVSNAPQDQTGTITKGISQPSQDKGSDSLVRDEQAQDNPGSKKVKPKRSRTSDGFSNGLTVGIIGAPDMSNVKFTNTDKVGFNAGIQIGYRFGDRWNVSTGVLFTRKNYTARGKDFTAPKGTWFDNITLDKVEGYCTMVDFPVNVRYDLTSGNRHRYFISTGLSSYLMKKEDYHYYYRYTNGAPGYRQRQFNSDEQHLFSILNVSAGFEKKISKRMSLQAEPYFKLPLTGLGYGNLKLNSYGIYFSLRYNTGLFGKK